MSASGPAGAVGAGRLLARPRFELVPIGGVDEQISRIPRGATVSVTCSPRRGLEPTLLLSERLASMGFRGVPHVAARLVASRDHLAEVAGRLEGAGVREIFVIGGDAAKPSGPYGSALALLRSLADMDIRFERVGVAGYPERHPFIDEAQLSRALLDKQPLASYLVTQICFDPTAVVGWIEQQRRAGLRLPVYIGVPGAVNRAKLLEISMRIGVGGSTGYLRRHGNVVARLARRAGYRPDSFVRNIATLLDGTALDVAGFHINTFNQVEATERWRWAMLEEQG